MKNVLIVGKNSYIGKNLKKKLQGYFKDYLVDSITVKDDYWKYKDFSKYDVVVHLSAIVHKKEKNESEELYNKVNCDLATQVAEKAKNAGVPQFVFMSTMAVYGEEGNLLKEIVINKNTKENPKTFYGTSKLLAEKNILKLKDNNFKVTIIRPPMVYGENCPGNYIKLEKLALKVPVFPYIENQRSMIHINKLCDYIKLYIDNCLEGIFLPQDDNYVNSSLLVKEIGAKNGKYIHLSKFLGFIIKTFLKDLSIVKKIFGNLVYEK